MLERLVLYLNPPHDTGTAVLKVEVMVLLVLIAVVVVVRVVVIIEVDVKFKVFVVVAVIGVASGLEDGVDDALGRFLCCSSLAPYTCIDAGTTSGVDRLTRCLHQPRLRDVKLHCLGRRAEL